MRNVMMAVVAVGMLAGTSLGVINVKLTADGPVYGGVVGLPLGTTTTVYIWAQGTSAGVFSLAGDIVASGGAGTLTSSAGSMVIADAFSPTYMYTAKPGTQGINGGWSNFGSLQKTWDQPDSTLGKDGYVLFGKYTVTVSTCNVATLQFVPKTVSGFKVTETDKTTVMGQSIPVTISEVPEPVTVALLGLAGLMAVSRRGW